MPDPTPTPSTAPEASASAPSRRTRSAENKQQLEALQKAEEILNVALKTEYASRLAKRDIKAEEVQTDQTSAQSVATTERKNLETTLADITRRRREIQLAADAVWPPENKANAGIRKEFFLPPNKAFKG